MGVTCDGSSFGGLDHLPRWFRRDSGSILAAKLFSITSDFAY